MSTLPFASRAKHSHPALWWKRAGVAGFAFFLTKGLLWLLAPAALYLLGG